MSQLDGERERDLGQLADLITDELTADEAAHVRERIEHDDHFQQLVAPVLAAWVVGHAESPTSHHDAHAALVERMAAIDRARAVHASIQYRRRRWAGGALVGLASAALFYVTLANVPPGRRLLARIFGVPADFAITTAVGEWRSILLRDGSRVTIGSDTRLSYRASFLEPVQLFTMQGAATFDVAPQHFGSFRVAAGGIFAQVKGTRFTIRAYPSDAETSVTVSRGRVKVAGPDFRDVDVDSGFVARVVGRGLEVKPTGADGGQSDARLSARFAEAYMAGGTDEDTVARVALLALRGSALGAGGPVERYIMLPGLVPLDENQAVSALAAIGKPAQCSAWREATVLWLTCWARDQVPYPDDVLLDDRPKEARNMVNGLSRALQVKTPFQLTVRDPLAQLTISDAQFERFLSEYHVVSLSFDTRDPKAGVNAVVTFGRSQAGNTTITRKR